MEVALPIILFVAGFAIGAFMIWQIKQKENEERQRMETELEKAFSNLSSKALERPMTKILDLNLDEQADVSKTIANSDPE